MAYHYGPFNIVADSFESAEKNKILKIINQISGHWYILFIMVAETLIDRGRRLHWLHTSADNKIFPKDTQGWSMYAWQAGSYLKMKLAKLWNAFYNYLLWFKDIFVVYIYDDFFLNPEWDSNSDA